MIFAIPTRICYFLTILRSWRSAVAVIKNGRLCNSGIQRPGASFSNETSFKAKRHPLST
ncbi:MAG: hypothetical protein KKB91_05640 [Proteobacteria bacterium]|nr:hypothetical protein [Pseudomonadota bacterium]MBU4027629.1 hypothetical protein [Pseudomonadota bacterium]MBU4084527.1 hypothetical protein [Pseudomonadota bacterium]MBU4106878.1 hypothetical protein [Pseudomonadota bacterium]MBU4234849.1 hypothetical protein [Pseudomonadota bacterium]